jgi:hypothetical protein
VGRMNGVFTEPKGDVLQWNEILPEAARSHISSSPWNTIPKSIAARRFGSPGFGIWTALFTRPIEGVTAVVSGNCVS